MDLKELLGEELFNQVQKALGDNAKNFTFIGDGKYQPKERFDQINNELKEVKAQLVERDNQLKELSKLAKGNEELQNKIKELEEANAKINQEYQDKLLARERDYNLEIALRDAKARNPKALKALIDNEKLVYKDGKFEGLNEQLESIKKSDAYLFDEPTTIKAGKELTPPKEGDDVNSIRLAMGLETKTKN